MRLFGRSCRRRKATLGVVFGIALVYVLSPVFYWRWLLHELESGAYRPEADSIGPLVGFVVIWLLGLIWILLVAAVLTIVGFVRPRRA